MKILNLATQEVSLGFVQYKLNKFPDGQIDVVITDNCNPEDTVLIQSRFNSMNDLGVIAAATASLRIIGVKSIHLYIPYLLGARSDRKFVKGGNRFLKDVIASSINHLNFESVTVLDPHSDVAENVIDRFEKIDNIQLVKYAFQDLKTKGEDDLIIISPDAGAMKKIYPAAQAVSVPNVIIASKHRNVATGEILSTEVPGLGQEPGRRRYVIIDDICDGGRTFTEIAKVILNVRPKSIYGTEIYLVVTHGIFSADFTDLARYFQGIYCTNSYSDVDPNLEGAHIVKQLNIF